MYKTKKIGVVVPAYNTGGLIAKTVEGIPRYVDKIIVVDDASNDSTKNYINKLKDNRLSIIEHEKNKGVGAAIISGYLKAIDEGLDIVVVMAGDGQMNPDDLKSVIDPLVDDFADYVKGNRLRTNEVREVMPGIRFFGNSILTILTKIVSGYWHIMDPQCGYTAISKNVLNTIPITKLYPRYGFPNDILTVLNVYNFRVKDVPVTPIYGKEKSGIRLYSYVPTVSILLLRKFFWRLKVKYVIRDFHPIILFYFFGITSSLIGFFLGLFILNYKLFYGRISVPTVVLCAMLLLSGLQLILFGMWFDMQYNKDLEILGHKRVR